MFCVLSLLQPVDRHPRGSDDVVGKITDARVCFLAAFSRPVRDRGPDPYSELFPRGPRAVQVPALGSGYLPEGSRVRKRRPKMEGKKFTFRNCYKRTGSKRISPGCWKKNPGPLTCAKRTTNSAFCGAWGRCVPTRPRRLLLRNEPSTGHACLSEPSRSPAPDMPGTLQPRVRAVGGSIGRAAGPACPQGLTLCAFLSPSEMDPPVSARCL